MESRSLRSASTVTTARTGFFENKCIFCNKTQKKVKQQQQQLIQVITFEIQQSILNEATELADVDLLRKVNGVDLIAKEAKYHKSCRVTYANKANAAIREKKNTNINERQRVADIRKEAFASTVSFVQKRVLDDEQVFIANIYFSIFIILPVNLIFFLIFFLGVSL